MGHESDITLDLTDGDNQNIQGNPLPTVENVLKETFEPGKCNIIQIGALEH